MKILLLTISILISFNVKSQHYNEKYYQDAFANTIGGQTEYVLKDRTRVDILTNDYAIEVDFGKKWAESIGQSLYYSKLTGREPGILLILEDAEKEFKYLKRLLEVAKDHDITVWVIYSNLTYERIR